MKVAIAAAAALVGLTLAGTAQANPSSGMLLGVYAFPNYQGLRVSGTIPGYSAQGRIFAGDVLQRVTADGIEVFPTRSHGQIEFAKDQIGPFRPAALEVFRPGVGLVYLWVEFQPVGGAAAYSLQGPQKMEARMFTEQEKPGAALLFRKPSPAPGPQPLPMPQPRPGNGPFGPGPFGKGPTLNIPLGHGSASSLFGR